MTKFRVAIQLDMVEADEKVSSTYRQTLVWTGVLISRPLGLFFVDAPVWSRCVGALLVNLIFFDVFEHF
jgi:hypothetical protein